MKKDRQHNQPILSVHRTADAKVQQIAQGVFRLQVPEGSARGYRLAQLDDYGGLLRSELPWKPPWQMRLRARASASDIPGTWGFGLWNDPFGAGLMRGGQKLRLPALPDALWFFHASPPNHLSLYDDLPGRGMLAATFASRKATVSQVLRGAAAVPLSWITTINGSLRKLGQEVTAQDGVALTIDLTDWHTYQIDWQPGTARFSVDDEVVFTTRVVPQVPLGLVLWVDNQYAAFPQGKRLHFGRLANLQPAWIEVGELAINGEAARVHSFEAASGGA